MAGLNGMSTEHNLNWISHFATMLSKIRSTCNSRRMGYKHFPTIKDFTCVDVLKQNIDVLVYHDDVIYILNFKLRAPMKNDADWTDAL